MNVYADNAATTRMSQAAVDAMLPFLRESYGNPSSLYTLGQKAAESLQASRETMAKYLGCDAREITFTSGGSEADNQALLTAATLGARKGKKHIISTAFEHHAILHSLKRLEKQGFEVTLLDVHENGLVTAQQVADAIREDTCLVTVMYANNEIGTIQPIAEIGAVCRERGVLFHTDAVQAVGHMHIDVQEMGIDMLSLAGHKFRGPRGTGVLYVKNGIQLEPLVYGGGQERGLVSGTENTAGFIGLAAAMQDACEHLDEKMGYVKKLTDKLVKGIMENIPYSHYTGDPVNRLPGTASFVFEAIEGEGLILRLDNAGVCGSTGSACSTGSLDPSHVLMAIGLPHEIAHGSLRLTLGEQNTEEDVDYVIETVTDVVKTLRSMSPVWENGKPNLSAAADLTAHH